MRTGDEFNMRMEGAGEPLAGTVDSARRSGGFWIVWLEDRPSVRALSGDRRLEAGVSQAVLDALSEAPRVLSEALHLRVPHRPWDRVEVSIGSGTRTEGEALSLGSGCIRLTVGELTSATDAAGIARHEALHLLLASTLGGAEKWCDPELAFTDWIVRGIEGRLAPAIPRFRTPLPGLLDPVPASRLEVQRRLASAVEDVKSAQRYFGEALLEGLQRAAQGAGPAPTRVCGAGRGGGGGAAGWGPRAGVGGGGRGGGPCGAGALGPGTLARLRAEKRPLPALVLPAVPAVQVIDSSAFAAW